MKRTVVLTVALTALLCVATPARAEGGYVGLGYLETEVDVDTSSGWKVFAGYNAIPFFGIEGSYRDMGEFKSDSPDVKSEVEAFEFSARGILPLGKAFEIFGKLGWSRINEDLSGTLSGSLRQNQAIYGAGVAFNLKPIGFRAEWERFDAGTRADSFSLSVYARF